MIVVWSKQSKVVYLKFIDQTLENFSVKLAGEFIDDVNISMIYKYTSTKIEIVTFLFNRSRHKY